MSNTKIIELGYYHPSNANWSYHIFMIIDKTGARLYRSTFGGESRIIEKLEATQEWKYDGRKFEKLYIGKGSGVEWKYKDIKDLGDIEGYNGKNW
jgi:hypothetical protein